MDTDATHALIEALLEAYNAPDLDRASLLYAEDCRYVNRALGIRIEERGAQRVNMQTFLDIFPDRKLRPEAAPASRHRRGGRRRRGDGVRGHEPGRPRDASGGATLHQRDMLRVRAQGRADRHPTRLHRPSGEQGVRRPPRYGSYFEVAFVPLFTQVRGETVWKIGSGSESGLRGPSRGGKGASIGRFLLPKIHG